MTRPCRIRGGRLTSSGAAGAEEELRAPEADRAAGEALQVGDERLGLRRRESLFPELPEGGLAGRADPAEAPPDRRLPGQAPPPPGLHPARRVPEPPPVH